jgi:hypothetical protein
MSTKLLAEYHASHECDPGKCVCKCGCQQEMGCRWLGSGLCSRCHLEYIYDEEVHGFPSSCAAEEKGR